MKKTFISILFLITCYGTTFAQGGSDLPVIENFETDSVWIWKPWVTRSSDAISLKTRGSAHSGKFGLDCKTDLVKRTDKQIGLPGQAISWWIRFESNTRANCGFGINSSEQGYYLCIDPSTNTLHFANTGDYTNPLLKSVSQTYALNVWYRAEVLFNTTTNVTGKLYSANGITLLREITLEIPGLSPGGIAFRGLALDVDDIRGGTRMIPVSADTRFAPKMGEHVTLKNILFETGKSKLLPQSNAELDTLAAYLKRNPDAKITISGHTDNIGNEDHNRNLSQARAKAVADYLTQYSTNKTSIHYIGRGSSKPIATNGTEEGRQKNRRVEFFIHKK